MNVGNACPECGCSLPDDAPGGLCPECLIRQGISPIEPEELEPTTPSKSSFIPPTPSRLAPHFPQLEVIKLLGHGGMGAVYKARQIKLDRWVALKIIHSETARDPSFAERFTREARTLARLSHPGIVGVHDFGEIAGGIELDQGPVYYFLMEYVDGVNLRQLIAEQSLSPEQTLSIVPQICEALQYAHECGVVHRDIKPENILVDRHGKVKIADFGLARLVESSHQEYTLTGTHQVMGTPRYMSPEQMAGSHGVDHRADIYSLGVVFYELLTGEVPMGQFEPPSRRADTDERLDEVVMRALAREPERRFQSASEMKVRVDAFTSGTDHVNDLVAGAPEPPQSMSSIVEREVAAAWRWVAGEPDPWTRKQELPALLMFAIAVAGCLTILLPWMDYRIDEPAESKKARAAAAVTTDNGDNHAIAELAIVNSVTGTAYSGAAIASVAFAAIALLILATPRDMRRSVAWGLLLTVLAGIALVSVLAFHIEADQQRFTIRVFQDGQWIEEAISGAQITDTSRRIGYYAALGLAIAQLVFGATGVRHGIASRSRESVESDPGTPLARVRFTVPASSEPAAHVVDHFESHGYTVAQRNDQEWIFRRGSRRSAMFSTDIRDYETMLTVRIIGAPDDQRTVSCRWNVRTLGAFITRGDIQKLEAEGRELAATLSPGADTEHSFDSDIDQDVTQVQQPRFSRKAIVGAVWASIFFVGIPLFITPTMVVHRTSTEPGAADLNMVGPTMFMMLVGFALSLPVLTAPIGTTILGFVAVGEIRHSNGRLVGLGLAFLDAVFFPTLLIGSMLIAAVCLLAPPNERLYAGICTAGLVVVVTIIAWSYLWRSISGPLTSMR